MDYRELGIRLKWQKEALKNADGTRNRSHKTVTVDDKALLKTTKKLKKHLEDKLAKFKQEVLSGIYIAPSKLTFKEFYENEWKPKDAEPRLKRTTFLSHCSKIDHHALPAIGHLKLDEITTMRLVTLLNDFTEPGARIDKRGGKETISSRTIQYTFDVTMSIFKRTVEWKVINVNDYVDIPQWCMDEFSAHVKSHA